MHGTTEFRWIECESYDAPVAEKISYVGIKSYYKLQQKFTSPYVGEPAEWRDVEIVNE